MNETELWRELGQQLRVDSIRASNVTKSGHPTSSMSAADLMAVLLAKYLHYVFESAKDARNEFRQILCDQSRPRLARGVRRLRSGRS